ncbi:MAG TPA: M13-type metalloendopeptidase [Steroidobacteraceae bacterium]|nr:M13-type metalloendopeptidase [Steroidobacteraceae bacterium]
MKRLDWALGCVVLLAGIARAAEVPMLSGIDLQYVDDGVRAQDDFFRHINGKWLDTVQMPPDKARYGSFDQLRDDSLDQLRTIVDGLAQATDPSDPDQRKIADLYASFMDEAALETQGLKPLAPEFVRIEAITKKSEIPALIAYFNRIGVSAPYTPQVHQDAKDSTRYVFDLNQDGLGLPDRDYYLQDDARFLQIRARYAQHVTKMLELAGDGMAARDAKAIIELETALAKIQWTKVDNRDPVKTYNKFPYAQLPTLAPGYGWKSYLSASGVMTRTDYLIVSQPSYIAGVDKLLESTPLPVWKAYFRWRVISDFAPYLNKAFVDENFTFSGTTLRGIEQNRPRWKRGLELLEGAIGEGLGKLYVAKYFPPESKARMDQLVRNLLAAYAADIDTLDWMGPDTRAKAKQKLAKFTTKIGYPVKWRDYSALKVVRGDLVGDVIRAQVFEYNRNLNKLGKPIDHTEWDMTPQTVNAYYNPEENEIVFPAAILQPPFFNVKADDAVNYGGIGAVIGHEISHGFDDQGSQYDGDGNLLDPPGWFTAADLEQFKTRTHALVQQYAAYTPVPGYPINGELTLGENIADNSGLAIAFKAYRLSLGGASAPVIDGLTGEQRFFAGWAQVWRGKARESETVRLIKIDPHSPTEIRGTVPERNQAAFYDAYGVKPGDKMYLAPEQRVTLW